MAFQWQKAFSWSGGSVPNRPPAFLGVIQNQTYLQGTGIILDVSGYFSDVDGDSLTFSYDALPAGLSLNQNTGIITGTVTTVQSIATVISASDGEYTANSNTITWTITNNPPVFVQAIPSQSISVLDAFSLNVSSFVTDYEGDTLTYSVDSLPAGLSLDSNTGIVSGTPIKSGAFSSVFTVSDGLSQVNSNTVGWVIGASAVTPHSRTVIINRKKKRSVSQLTKDAEDVLDYSVDWLRWLEGDVIESATATIEAGLTLDSTEFNDNSVLIWLSGGTVDVSYSASVTIGTTQGRTANIKFTIQVEDQ